MNKEEFLKYLEDQIESYIDIRNQAPSLQGYYSGVITAIRTTKDAVERGIFDKGEM
jgi:hypothetical protein